MRQRFFVRAVLGVVAVVGVVMFGHGAAAAPAISLQDERIAVLEFKVADSVALQSPGAFADACRGVVVKATKSQGTLVLTRENMLEVLKATGGTCAEGECEVETARNLNVPYFVTGDVAKLGGQLPLTLKAYDTRKGALLGTARDRSTDEAALFDKVQPTTTTLLREAFGLRAGATTPPTSGGSEGRFGEGASVVAGDDDDDDVIVKFTRNQSAPLCASTASCCARARRAASAFRAARTRSRSRKSATAPR